MSQANLRSSLNFKKRKEVDEMSQETYTIGQVATRFNLSVSTLRYYDQEGLIPNLTKDQAAFAVSTMKISKHCKLSNV